MRVQSQHTLSVWSGKDLLP